MTSQEATDKLREMIKPGTTIYTVLRHVSASGMTRHIDVYMIDDGKLVYLSGYVAAALGYRRATGAHWALIVKGCGTDMGFDVVYNLSMALFCPDKYNHDAAYSLHHEWI